MRFRFCGGEDCADWILAEIFTLSKLSSVKLKLLCQQVMQAILTDNLNFNEAQKLVGDKFESSDLKASIRALQYILTMSAKHSVDGQSLLNELTQLGLPKEHASGLVKVYDENFDKLIDKLRSSVMRLTKLDDIQWNMFDIKTTNNLHNMHLPVVTMNLNYNDNLENQPKSISFAMNAEQFAVLFADLQAARDLIKTFFSSDTGTYKEPRPFFTASKKLIDDYFDGNLAHVSQTINSHTFVFVMYYAYFCGISRRMRDPYEKAATFYREQIHHGNNTLDKLHVKFIAVDCFYHNGQCRKSYKLNYFPQMFLYIKGTRGYQYFGPAVVSNLIEFIEKIRMPVLRLTNVNDFLDFNVQYESTVLASFDFSNDSQRYYSSLYVQTALKHIEYDNEHPIRFAIILNQSIVEELSRLYINNTFEKPFIVLHRLHSEPQAFPNMTNNFTMENLFQWIVDEDEEPHVGWLVPKNRYYSRSPSIDKATVYDALTGYENLLLFFTSNKFDELKLRQIYFHLSGCNITHASLWNKQLEQLYNRSFIDVTENLTKTQRHRLSSCCQYAFNQVSRDDIYNLCLLNQPLSTFNFSGKHAEICLPILKNISLQKLCLQIYCQEWLKNSSLIYEKRLKSNQEIVLDKRREKFFEHIINMQSKKIVDSENPMEKYKEFLCQTNSTWAFRLINSRDYPNFAQNIGVMNTSRIILVLQPKVGYKYQLYCL
ncbi:hypothetical protein I4U23_002672 [Adineta vaga]|nr:hypothetical protein I4U23_002672 [Adineta vaga]